MIRMKKAALSGAAMAIIIGLISALIALIIIWVFHEKVFSLLSDVLNGIVSMIKKILGMIFPWIYLFD